MSKNIINSKNIAVISFIVPVLGILSEFFNSHSGNIVRYISPLISSLSLLWISFDTSFYWSLNIFTVFFYALLLLGAILYVSSKDRESRLIRFVFAVILFDKSIFAVLAIISAVSGGLKLSGYSSIPFFILYFAVRLAWIWLSWQILAFFKQQKELATETQTYGEHVSITLVNATLTQRFFNLLTDIFVMILVFSMLFNMIIHPNYDHNIFTKLENLTGSKLGPLIIMLFCRSIYYISFELLLGATPGKLLTETRVVNDDDGAPDAKTVISRTLSRFVPFEGVSFFGDGRWHDRWSCSSVVSEKRTGADGGLYILIIPISVLIFAAIPFFADSYEHAKEEKQQKLESNQKQTELLNKLTNINTNTFVALKVKDHYTTIGTERRMYLKVEEIHANNIVFSKIKISKQQYDYKQLGIERLYKQQKDTAKKLTFTKEQLIKALYPEGTYPDESVPIQINGVNYEVIDIKTCCQINLSISASVSYQGNYLQIGVFNEGWPAILTAINVVQGDVKISNKPPIHYQTGFAAEYGSIYDISGWAKDNSDFKIDLTMQDTTGGVHIYQLNGNTAKVQEVTVKQVK